VVRKHILRLYQLSFTFVKHEKVFFNASFLENIYK